MTAQVLVVVSIVLDQGRRIHGMSSAITVAALIGCVLPALSEHRMSLLSLGILGAVIAVGVIELWFAIRVSIDAALFRRLARVPDWRTLDEALINLGMIPAEKTGRPEAVRIAGARRLLRFQAVALIAQIGLAVILAVIGATK